MKYSVGGYERLSKEDEHNDESSSIESQRMIIESYVQLHHLTLFAHYSDDGYSGSHYQRPGFLKLKQDIEQGKINCVIVKDLSRLGRELYETGLYIEDYFIMKGVRFIAISDHYDSCVGDEMLALRLSVNDLYLRDTSKKIRMAFDAKRQKGEYIASRVKYGYRKDPQNSHHLIVDCASAQYVKMIFVWLSQGVGTVKIAKRLTDMHVTIPSLYQKERIPISQNGGIWRSQTVREIGKDQMYLGHMVQGKWKKVSYHSKKLMMLPEEKWIVVKNTHEAIVDQVLFDQAQIMLNKNKKYRNTGKKYKFQGLLYCHECHHRISVYQRQNHLIGQCNNYTKNSQKKVCCSHSFDYLLLQETIENKLKEIGQAFYLQNDELVGKMKEHLLKQNKEQQGLVNKIKKDIIKTQNILNQLYEDRLHHVISLSQYQSLSSKYQSSLTALVKQQMQIEKQINKTVMSEKDKALIEKYMTFQIADRYLLDQVIDRIEIDQNRHVFVYFKTDMSLFITKVK